MATAPTSKKIQRVQQSGVTRRAGQRRSMGFPLAVVAILVLGTIGVLLAREARLNVGGERPRANQDSWYQAFGFYNCDAYEANLAAPETPGDITTLGNGLISISPLSDETAGDNATFGKFLDDVGIKVTENAITLPDGTKHEAGDECGAGKRKTKDTEVKLFIWPPQASNKTEPEVVTSDFGSVRFEQDGGAYAIALVPASTVKIDLPDSVGNLSSPEANIPATTAAPSDSPTTTAENATPESTPEATTAPETTAVPETTAAPTTTEG